MRDAAWVWRGPPFQRLFAIAVYAAGTAFMLGMLIWTLTLPKITWAAVVIALAGFAVAATLLLRSFGVAVAVTREHFVLRGFLRVRTTRWHEIRNIAIARRGAIPLIFVNTIQGARYALPSMLQYRKLEKLEELCERFDFARRTFASETTAAPMSDACGVRAGADPAWVWKGPRTRRLLARSSLVIGFVALLAQFLRSLVIPTYSPVAMLATLYAANVWGVLCVRSFLAAAIATSNEFTLRGSVRTRCLRWTDIESFVIARRSRRKVVFVQLSSGKRFPLPWLLQPVAGREPEFCDQLQRMHELALSVPHRAGE